MADEDQAPASTPEPDAERGIVARFREHLMDLTPLRESRDFRLLFIGKSVSDFGDEIVATVVPFQVYQLTHSTLAVGLLGLCALVPVFVFPIVGGAFADAVERRRFVIVMHAILAVMSALMAVNATLDQPLLWPLYVFATLSAGLYTFNRPAMSTWPARLLPPDLLPSSNALEAGFHTVAAMAGPVLAGVLILTIEPAGAFVVDVVLVPRRDRVRVADEALAARTGGCGGQLGRDRRRVPVREGQAHDPVGLRGRPRSR